MIEASLSMALLCLIMFGLLQVSMLYSADEILHHSAVSTARSRTVGFNSFMLEKVSRVAAIPNAGPLLNPDVSGINSNPQYWENTPAGQIIDDTLNPPTSSPQADIELSRIPLYMATENPGELPAILEYRDWDTVQYPQLSFPSANSLQVRVSQTYPLSFPLHRAYYADDEVRIRGEARMEDHAELYLQ
jgi:hypothetical protein